MLSREDAKNIIDKVIGYSKLPQCQIDLNWTEDVFIRFANNGITTSGYRVTQQASISSVTEDKREGNAVVSELNDGCAEARRRASRATGSHLAAESGRHARAGAAEIPGAEKLRFLHRLGARRRDDPACQSRDRSRESRTS